MHDVFALIFLAAALCMIFGVRGLRHPKSARRGNQLSMAGMLLALLATLALPQVTNYFAIFTALAIGAAMGLLIALKVKTTGLPQLVALFNSFVGLAAVLLAVVSAQTGQGAAPEQLAGSLIGAVTFTGSVLAYGKLQGLLASKPHMLPQHHIANILILAATAYCGAQFIMTGNIHFLLAATALISLFGITLVLAIGGADMPVVISTLNCYSGFAAAATGFMLQNILLVIAGALVGASGLILTLIMCQAMNRSFLNVILGGFGDTGAETATTTENQNATAQQASPTDAGFMLQNSRNVMIIPGYGMAVAQAQHALKEVYTLLSNEGINTSFAIHPVAGRMPGHMNVLLAEADVPYDAVQEIEAANTQFPQADVVLVIGANDVVNPDAITEPGSPLYGMPILEAYKAKQVYVIKRSLKSGYAGVENSLFFRDNTAMIFGDAKAVCEEISQALKA